MNKAKKQLRPRWEDEPMSTKIEGNPRACETCIFRSTVFNGRILDIAKSYHCEIYEEPDHKPDDVYWKGADCGNYQQADDRPQRVILGVAVGDALGVPVEFKKRGTFQVKDMQGYGTYNQPPGTWSDDTSLTLALIDNMGCTEIFMEDLANSLIRWRDKGEYTPHGETFDIGNATNRAIDRLKKGVEQP